MSTQLVMFPLDEFSHLYAVQDEHGNYICTGSRQTCYRLLELLARSQWASARPLEEPAEAKFTAEALREVFARWGAAAADQDECR